ncbi:MAG: lipid A biosynthesis acyltransferase [Ramlibacter sp.]|nr:lipid A biosynthesis acyltransferase [Ramlibacter sp.]
MSSAPARAGGRLLLGFLWLLQKLPLAWQAAAGRGLGALLWRVAGSRRRVALRNLQLCLPEMAPPERERMARACFNWFGRSVLERGLLWYAPAERLRGLIHVEGDVGFADRHDGPVMWLVPHFVGLDIAGAATQLHVKRRVASIYQAQTNAVLDEAVRKGRLRHGNADIFSRGETAKPLMRAVRQGAVFFNLPDMDFGERDAAFVPFFGVPAATLLAPSRMARALGMKVQPVLTELLPGGQGWRVRFMPPWDDFPTDDPLADTARMNQWIEAQVRALPEQYLWVHKRFKTRPAGEPPVY